MRAWFRARAGAIGAALALLVALTWLSRDFGATWDERFQQKYGERVLDYWRGRLPRADFEPAPGSEYLYGGLVDLLSVGAQHLVDADVYVVRHAVNSFFGWLGIVFAGLLAARLSAPRAGWFAAGLLTLSPRYFADSMNNPKDVPFAALALVVLYYTLTIRRRLPPLTWAHAAKLGLAVALAINVRPLGLALLAMAVAYILLTTGRCAWSAAPEGRASGVGVTLAAVAAVALLAIPAGTVTWPWAQEHRFARPIEAFAIASRLDWAQGFPVLYRGQDLAAHQLPWHYVPLWLGISLPPAVLVGLALSPLALARRGADRLALAALLAFALAPVSIAILRQATLYDGIRHLAFIVPPLVVLSAIGWHTALAVMQRPLRLVLAAGLALGAAETIAFHVRNHPNQSVYFSPIAGGPRRAFGRFDMDYWGNCALQAVEWSAELADRASMGLVVSGEPFQVVLADAGRFRALGFSYGPRSQHHLFIRLLRGSSAAVKADASRPDVLHAVRTADGTPLCIVLPGPAFPSLAERLKRVDAH